MPIRSKVTAGNSVDVTLLLYVILSENSQKFIINGRVYINACFERKVKLCYRQLELGLLDKYILVFI